MDSLCKCRKAAFNFVFIYYPIAKCTEIIVSLAKPAIIQNKHIKTDIFCLFCDMIQFICIKIKVGCLPVINQDRSWLIDIFTADQIASVGIMIISGKSAKSFCGICHDHFRSFKNISFFQRPGEMIWIDSHFYTGMPYLIYFGFKYKKC